MLFTMFSSVEGVEAKFLESILFNSVNQKLRPRDSYPGRGAVGIVGDVCDAPAQCINKTVLQSNFISLTSFFLRVYLVFLFKYSIVCA